MALLNKDFHSSKAMNRRVFNDDGVRTKRMESYDPMLEYLDLEPKDTGKLGLRLYIPSMEKPVVITAGETKTIGRKVFGEESSVDIDLRAVGGKILGVSREHVTIMGIDGQYYVKDMCSTNGTYVNGQQLAPYQMYPLHYGDKLLLGHLMISVG